MKKFSLLLIVCSLLSVPGFSQEDRIDTDRPDQTESPSLVPKKWMQVEMGFLRQSDKNPALGQQRFRDISFEHPSVLLRYGLAKCFELRFESTYATSRGKEDNTIIDRENGIASVQLGAKLNFFSEKGLRPKTSLVAHYDFARLRTLNKDSIDGASFLLAMQNTVSKKIGVGYNVGIEWDRFGDPPAYIFTVSPGFDLSDNWSAFIEMFSSFMKKEKPQNSIDGGIVFYPGNNVKLDISAGFGLSKAAPDWFISFGGSFRFRTGKSL